MMDWTARPLHATNLQTRNFQVQGLCHSQQPAPGFSQASTLTQNFSTYTRNDQAVKIHSSSENMVPNQLSSSNNVGFSNFQPLRLKSSAPFASFETNQHFVGHHPHLQLSSMTVQMTGMGKNTWPNSNTCFFTPVAPQTSTANPVQRPPNQYIASDMYNNRPQKTGFDSVQGSVFHSNINSSKRLLRIMPKYQPTNPQSHSTVPLNQVSSHFLNSQHNSSSLTFSSGQNVQNQINDINSGSTTAVQLQQYASNCAYSSPHTMPTHYAAQVIPQAINTNSPPPYPVPPKQVNHGQLVVPQLDPNTFNENVQNSQNRELDQSSVSYSVKHVQTPESVPISRETNEVGHAADSLHGLSAENQPSDEFTKSAIEALKNICNNLQIPQNVPLDKTSIPQTTGIMAEDNTTKNSGNVLDNLIKSKPLTRESLELNFRNILKIKKILTALKSKRHYSHVAQKSKTSDPSVHNPDRSLPTSSTSQQPAPLPQATHQNFSLPSHDTTQNLTALLPHDNTQNQPPSLLACSSNLKQDSSLLPSRKKECLRPILVHLLKGTADEEMLHAFASTERNQNKQLFVPQKCSFSSVLESSGAKFETSMNDMERVSRLSPKTSQTASTQGSLTSMDQLTNTSAMSGGDLFNCFVQNKDEMEMIVSKIPTNPQNTAFVQNPTAISESSQINEQLAEVGSKNFQNPRSAFIWQSKDNFLRMSEKSITTWKNGTDISGLASLASTFPEADRAPNSSFTENSCTMGRTFSLEELQTGLALWRKSPATSVNYQSGEKTKSTMHSSSLDGVQDKEMKRIMKYFPNALIHYEKSSTTVGKNEPTLSSVSSSLRQNLDAASSSSSKSSEPQVAIVPPLILSKVVIQNEVQEENLSSELGKMHPVLAEGSIHSLHEFALPLSDTDKSVKRTACSPSSSYGTVKEGGSDMHQKTDKSIEENGIRRSESGTDCSCDSKQELTGTLELEKNTLQLCSRDSFPPGSNNDSSSPISQKCALKTSTDLVEAEDTVLNESMLQISSVCTLVQGDAFYNSQIASIFNTSSKAENDTSSEGQRPDSYHKEQQVSQWKTESEMNGRTSVGDISLPSQGTSTKAITEKLSSSPGLKISQSGKDSDEVNVINTEEEKNSELINPSSGNGPEQNISCIDVHSMDLAFGYQEVPGNSIDECSTHGVQEHIPSNENLVRFVNNTDIALTLPNDQLTELLKEFPYGIDDSKALKKTENEYFSTKVNEIKDVQGTQSCGQNSEANHALDQIIITILNPQQMKELFPENSSQSSNKLENRENDKLQITSEDTNKSHTQTILVESTDTSAETVLKPATHSYCCLSGWIASEYAVVPCAHMLAKEAALKQQLGQDLPPEIIIKEGPETETSTTDCQLNNPSSNIISEVEGNRILNKSIVHRESNLQKKECELLKEDKGLSPFSFLDKLELLKPNSKEQRIEELTENVQMDELCNQKCTTLVSKSQVLYSGTNDSKEESIRSAHRRESSDKERTPEETVVGKSKSDALRHRSMENKHGKKIEKYKIKRDSSETHIIKGPTYPLKGGIKKHITGDGKLKTKESPCSTVTNSSNIGSVDSVSKAFNNAQYSQKHLNRQKCEIEKDLENNKAVRVKHKESRSSESVQQNKGSFARANLKKFAYSEERGNVWKYRRSLSDNIKTSKMQTFRGQYRNMYKAHYSGKEVVWGAHKRDRCFEKTLSDKKSSCNRKNNILTLQREQKKNYLNKVAFKQTEKSICLTKLEQSPSKSIWHVKSSSALEHPEDKKKYTLSTQQSEVVKPQMLEFKMCPEIMFRSLVSEEISDAKKLPEKERIPISAVRSRREDWLNYTPLKRRKTDEKATQVDDCIPLDTAMELLDKNEVIKNSKATFETYRKMHQEKRSRSLDSSPLN